MRAKSVTIYKYDWATIILYLFVLAFMLFLVAMGTAYRGADEKYMWNFNQTDWIVISFILENILITMGWFLVIFGVTNLNHR
jgi:hypothetical protein